MLCCRTLWSVSFLLLRLPHSSPLHLTTVASHLFVWWLQECASWTSSLWVWRFSARGSAVSTDSCLIASQMRFLKLFADVCGLQVVGAGVSCKIITRIERLLSRQVLIVLSFAIERLYCGFTQVHAHFRIVTRDKISFPLHLFLTLSYRWGSIQAVWHPGPLPGWHQPLCHGHCGLPDAETQPLPQRRVWLCQEEEVQHFPKLQLHGPALGLWEDAGPAKPVWQPFHQQGAAVLHHADQSQRLPAGHAGVNMRMVWNSFLCLYPVVSRGLCGTLGLPMWQYLCTKRKWKDIFSRNQTWMQTALSSFSMP